MRLPPRPAPSAWSSVVRWLRHWAVWFGWRRITMAVLSALMLIVTVVWLVPTPDPGESAPEEPTAVGANGANGESGDAAAPVFTLVPPPPEMVAVHVLGAVFTPGVVWLDTGARVVDAIDAAGGPVPEAALDAVNLAAVVVDGQRLRVPFRGEELSEPIIEIPIGEPVMGGEGASAGLIDLNRATADELEALPGIGPVTAAAIVAHRERHGRFRSVDDLLRVAGIGPARLEAIRDLVTI